MSVVAIVLVSIFVPIGILVFFAVAYILLKKHLLRHHVAYLESLENFLSQEPYIDTLTTLRTVDISLQKKERDINSEMTLINNDQLDTLTAQIDEINKNKDFFATQQLNIERKIKDLNTLKEELLRNLENSRVFSSRKIISEIEHEKNEMEKIKKLISEETKPFINPINDFINKRDDLIEIAKNLEDTTRNWLNEISDPRFDKNVNEQIRKMNDYLGTANDYISKGLRDKSFEALTMFKKILYDLLIFGNHFKKFKKIIFIESSEMYAKVVDFLKKTREKLSDELRSLNAEIYFENFKGELEEAKNEFFKMNVEGTKKNIEAAWNTLYGITRLLNQEIIAHTFLEQNKIEEINEYFNEATNYYNKIKESCEKILYIDNFFYWNLQNNGVDEITNLINEINQNITLLKNSLTNKEVLYSTKKSQYTKILELLKDFFEQCNNIERSVNIFYTDGHSQGLRYDRLRKIYIKGLAELKSKRIILNIEDNEIIKLIENKKYKIENHIGSKNKEDNDFDIKKNVDEMFNLVTTFVLKVLKKNLVVKLFEIISIDNSYRRLSDNMFNMKIVECENLLNEGRYDEGFRGLISNLRGGNN